MYNSSTGRLISHVIASAILLCKQRTPCAILSCDRVTGNSRAGLWWPVILVRSLLRNKADVVWREHHKKPKKCWDNLCSLSCSISCWTHSFSKMFALWNVTLMNQFSIATLFTSGTWLPAAPGICSWYGFSVWRLVLGFSVSQERAKCTKFSVVFKNLSLHLFETQWLHLQGNAMYLWSSQGNAIGS